MPLYTHPVTNPIEGRPQFHVATHLGEHVGQIRETGEAMHREGGNWRWQIRDLYPVLRDSVGREDSYEAAKAALAKSWRRWLEVNELDEMTWRYEWHGSPGYEHRAMRCAECEAFAGKGG